MKVKSDHIETGLLSCIDCITGRGQTLLFADGALAATNESEPGDNALFAGPGLIDLQVNGINGIDFNSPSVTVADIINATQYLLSQCVTTFFPTVVTNSDENIVAIMQTIAEACERDPLVNACVGGIHLEGPFISPQPGAKGAHNEKYIKAPDWELFNRFQHAAGGRIKIITLAPEWDGATAFIKNCAGAGVIVSIGHSLANTQQIRTAVKAGARMSTHLGNGVPLMLQRHPNLIWDQLAEEDLYTCMIADGIHIPDSFIKVVQKAKGNRALIVSDATCFAGMAPGEYKMNIGGDVVLDENKRVSLKSTPGLLAGAAKTLLENVETLLAHQLFGLSASWQMASLNVSDFLTTCGRDFETNKEDRVIFTVQETSIHVRKVIKNGRLVFSN